MTVGSAARSDTSPLESVRFPVHGMTCTSCVVRITRALRSIDGVSRVRVDLGAETATVTRVIGTASDESLTAAVAGAGYAADLSRVTTEPATPPAGLLARLFRR